MATEKKVVMFDGVTIDQDRTSTTADISQIYGYSIYAEADSGVGTLSIQSSVDGINFFETDTAAISGATVIDFNKPDQMYAAVKFVYTFTSGTGTLNACMLMKR